MDRSVVPPRPVLVARKVMNDVVRRYFDDLGFLEVETPIAVTSPGLEPHLVAFSTTEVGPDGRHERRWLHTSPEYAMKRMLARGTGHIYQLARVFRNGERSRTHAPEFTMLEWYRSPGTLDEIMDDTIELVDAVARAVKGPWRPRRSEKISVSEAFVRAGLGDPLEHEDRVSLASALGMPERAAGDDTWDDLFFRAFFEKVEPTFRTDTLTVLYGYPAKMAALARIDQRDPRRAERFEVYVGATELANAFGELADPVEQRQRFEEDLAVRRAKGAEEYPIDEGLLEDLPKMGESAGIALGVDRLLMTCLGLPAIQDVIAFSPRDE